MFSKKINSNCENKMILKGCFKRAAFLDRFRLYNCIIVYQWNSATKERTHCVKQYVIVIRRKVFIWRYACRLTLGVFQINSLVTRISKY